MHAVDIERLVAEALSVRLLLRTGGSRRELESGEPVGRQDSSLDVTETR